MGHPTELGTSKALYRMKIAAIVNTFLHTPQVGPRNLMGSGVIAMSDK